MVLLTRNLLSEGLDEFFGLFVLVHEVLLNSCGLGGSSIRVGLVDWLTRNTRLHLVDSYRPRPTCSKSSSRSSSALAARAAAPRALLAGLGSTWKSSCSLPSVAGDPFDARVDLAGGGRFGEVAWTSLVFLFVGMVRSDCGGVELGQEAGARKAQVDLRTEYTSNRKKYLAQQRLQTPASCTLEVFAFDKFCEPSTTTLPTSVLPGRQLLVLCLPFLSE